MTSSLLSIAARMPETVSGSADVLPGVDALRTAILADDTTTATAEFVELTAGLELGELTRVLLAVEEAARERHLRAGIPLDITAATLADVGRKLDAYGATVDRPWLVSLLRGDVLAFGRLQFEATMPGDGRALHIPEGGSLTATEVDDALARADAFIGGRTVVCTSWLFDPALAALPETSNISAFVRRFDVGEIEPTPAGSEAVAKFVFRRPLARVLDPVEVVPASRVQRIVADHLRSGQHWSEPRATLRR